MEEKKLKYNIKNWKKRFSAWVEERCLWNKLL